MPSVQDDKLPKSTQRELLRARPHLFTHKKFRTTPKSLSLRLLKLRPGPEDELIRGDIEEYTLETAPLYTVMSYMWGIPGDG